MTTTSEPAPCQQTVHFISEYLSKPPIFPVPALKMNLLVFSAAFTMIVTIHGGELLTTEGFLKGPVLTCTGQYASLVQFGDEVPAFRIQISNLEAIRILQTQKLAFARTFAT